MFVFVYRVFIRHIKWSWVKHYCPLLLTDYKQLKGQRLNLFCVTLTDRDQQHVWLWGSDAEPPQCHQIHLFGGLCRQSCYLDRISPAVSWDSDSGSRFTTGNNPLNHLRGVLIGQWKMLDTNKGHCHSNVILQNTT